MDKQIVVTKDFTIIDGDLVGKASKQSTKMTFAAPNVVTKTITVEGIGPQLTASELSQILTMHAEKQTYYRRADTTVSEL